MMTIKELKAKWDDISPYSGGFLLVSGDHPLSFHIGYLGGEQKCFIVLNTGKIEKVISSKAILVECIETEDGTYALRFLLNYPSLDELFVKLCWDLIDSSRNDAIPVKKILSQYFSWQKLLQQAGNGLMSSSVQKGLIGELMQLSESIAETNAENALNAWVGPEGSDQDFLFSDHWEEVKAVSIAADEVMISSLQQLDRTDDGMLIVYFMDKTTSTGQRAISLPEVIGQVRQKLHDSRTRDEFDCKLAKCGYLDKDSEVYKEIRYRIAEKRVFNVDNVFPRLTRKNVSIYIASVKYGINLAMIEPYRN